MVGIRPIRSGNPADTQRPTTRRVHAPLMKLTGAASGVVVTVILMSAAMSNAATPASAASATTTTSNIPGAGGAGGGTPPTGGQGGTAGGGSTSPVIGTGAYTQSGGTSTKSGVSWSAASSNESGVLVKSDGQLTLKHVNVSTTGSSSSSDDSSFYGLDAGVLAINGSHITQIGGSVTTIGNGANGVFAYGSGSSVLISGATITASGQYAHGIMSAGGGKISASNLDVTTSGASSAAVATDRGGGNIAVRGGMYVTRGMNSPGIYSTGTIKVSGGTYNAQGAEAAVVEGANSVTAVDASLTGHINRGVMIYQSMSGDAQGTTGVFSESHGSLTALSGPLFYVTNTSGTVHVTSVRLTVSSGVLLDAAAGNWGTAGSNGGTATIDAVKQVLVGAVDADSVSSATLNLTDGSSLKGAVNSSNTAKRVTISLDKTSRWTVGATSYVTVLDDSAGLQGSSITNIVGNGHTVHYDSAANPSLAGKTYTLVGGGELVPD